MLWGMRRRPKLTALLAIAMVAAPGAASAAADPLPADTVAARKHFLGSDNVAGDGSVRGDRVVLSWFSVASFAMAIDGRVVLLDSYIHKGEDRPGHVPTTTKELIALRPEAILLGHGHFDHGKNAGVIAARTGAVLIGTPEHCEQARKEAAGEPGGQAAVRCVEPVARGEAPGAQVKDLTTLGPRVGLKVLKHVHSDTEPPDGEQHESALHHFPAPDAGNVLLHPPGPSVVGGLNPGGDEGGSLLYRFEVGPLSLVWHDSSGPLREQAPQILPLLRGLPATDIQVGAVLGFNEPTNGVRDPVDYIAALRPRLFVPNHHDFVAEYGAGRSFEPAVRRELAKRGPVSTEFRWINERDDYLRPSVLTFDVASGGGPQATPSACLPRRARTSGGRSIGRLRVGARRSAVATRAQASPAAVRARSLSWCVAGAPGRMTAVFTGRGDGARARLVATTSPAHRTRGVGPGARASKLRARFPRARSLRRGVFQAAPRSRRVFVVRAGRVRALAVASRTLLRRRGSLGADLREAAR